MRMRTLQTMQYINKCQVQRRYIEAVEQTVKCHAGSLHALDIGRKKEAMAQANATQSQRQAISYVVAHSYLYKCGLS